MNIFVLLALYFGKLLTNHTCVNLCYFVKFTYFIPVKLIAQIEVKVTEVGFICLLCIIL